MSNQTFNPDGLPHPKDSYFQVTVAEPDSVIGIASQTASDGQGGLVGVESVGGSVEDIILVSVFLTGARFFRDVNEVRMEESRPSYLVSTMVQHVPLAEPG